MNQRAKYLGQRLFSS